MTFKPAYRGTVADLNKDRMKVRDWFIAQVQTAIEESSATDEIKEYAREFDFVVGLKIFVERTGRYFYGQKQEHSDYFYVFKVREGWNAWREKRLVIRKDGTINIENAVNCYLNQMLGKRNAEKQDDVFGKNRLIWNDHFSRSTETIGEEMALRISLSRVVVGECNVESRHYNPRISKTSIKIADLERFSEWWIAVRKEFEAFK